jgi:hypothetical protein
MITTLRANGDKSPELQVEPDGMEMFSAEDGFARLRVFVTPASVTGVSGTNEVSGTEDALVELFRRQFQAPVESFLQQMREQRQSAASNAG